MATYLDLEELIDLSIRYEKDNAQYYRDILAYITDGRRRALIQSLIKQEEEHQNKLKAFKGNMEKAGFVQFPPEIKFSAPRTGGGFEHISYYDLVRHAIEIEKLTFDFYESAASESPRGPVKELFDALSNFERSHIEILKRELTYSS
jgi:rubrerythrin